MSELNNNSEFYLHTNGKIIFKPHGGVDVTSPLVVQCWKAVTIGQTPRDFSHWLRKVYKLGANKSEVIRLAEQNQLEKYSPKWREQVLGE